MAPVTAIEFPVVVTELNQQMPIAPLGPGVPVQEMKPKLIECAASWPKGLDRNLVQACQAGLWLGFNFLDESHSISQDLDTVEGSYWHGILHRREPDAGNAAYWFRRVGQHPIFDSLVTVAHELDLPLRSPRWDPFAFINLCEQYRDSGNPEEEKLRQVQKMELELLLQWCWLKANGQREQRSHV